MREPLHPGSSLGQLARFVKSFGTSLARAIESNSEPMITFLILIVLGGLIVGALGRLALPGPDPMGILATIGVGIAGSLLAGVVSALLVGSGGETAEIVPEAAEHIFVRKL